MSGMILRLLAGVPALAENAPAVAAQSGMPLWATILLTVVGAGAVGSVGTIVLLPKSAKKIDAETSEIFTGAAVALVKPLNEQITSLTTRVADLEQYKTDQTALLVEHASWDQLALSRLRAVGVELPPVPPLHPLSV